MSVVTYIGERVRLRGYYDAFGTVVGENSFRCKIQFDNPDMKSIWGYITDCVLIERDAYEDFEEKIRDRMF